MSKEKTVNLRLKNAILCFGVVSVNKLAVSVMAFFFAYGEGDIGG